MTPRQSNLAQLAQTQVPTATGTWWVVEDVPLQRIARPDDIGGGARHLASPAAAWVTGTVLTVDGGLSLT